MAEHIVLYYDTHGAEACVRIVELPPIAATIDAIDAILQAWHSQVLPHLTWEQFNATYAGRHDIWETGSEVCLINTEIPWAAPDDYAIWHIRSAAARN